MKFKEQIFFLFAYTNYRAIQGYHRLETLDFKGKGAFYHSIVQQGLSMFFVEQPSHVETVVILSQRKADDYVEVELELDELDVTSAESKATYKEIQEYVLKERGLKVSNLYISQVKKSLLECSNKCVKADAELAWYNTHDLYLEEK